MFTSRPEKRILQMNSKLRNLIAPITGAISYEIFSTKILLNQRFSAIFGSKDAVAADIVWMNAHIGFGLYLFQHKLFSQVPTHWRITYSVFGATMFNFGSALFWGTARALFPEASESLRLIFGLGSGMILMYIGWNFVKDMTDLCFKTRSSAENSKRSIENKMTVDVDLIDRKT